MTSEERRAWLDSLKVGDEVAVELRDDTPFYGGYHAYLANVARRECGFIWTSERGLPFPTDTGFRKSECTGSRCIYSLSPVTQVVAEYVIRHDLKLRMKEVEKLPIATVRKLLAVLAEAEQEGKENT
jgi:hypothetical protein